MEIIKYIFLGILHGITEPIPVSSSGHFRLFRELFNTDIFNDLNFEIFVNFGSFLAILFIFRKDIKRLIKSFFNYLFNKDEKEKKINYNNWKYCWYVIIGTMPALIIGLLFKNKIENLSINTNLLGLAFLITALSLFVVRNTKGSKNDDNITTKDAILIGLMQALALMPGISRIGTALVGCLLRDFKRDTALKFSFMLYFPISITKFILGLFNIIKDNQFNSVIIPYSIGTVAAIITTYFATKWLFSIVRQGKLMKFVMYCLFLGLFSIMVL